MTPASSSRATSSWTCWRPRTREDGSDLGPCLARLFQVLNTPVDRRQAKLDEDLARFPYVNGDLFRARLTIPDFDAAMRAALIDACRFNWEAISTRHLRCALPVRDGTRPSAAPRVPTTRPRRTS